MRWKQATGPLLRDLVVFMPVPTTIRGSPTVSLLYLGTCWDWPLLGSTNWSSAKESMQLKPSCPAALHVLPSKHRNRKCTKIFLKLLTWQLTAA